MFSSTEALVKIFEECELKYRVDEVYACDTNVISVRMKMQHSSHTDFAIFVSDSEIEANIQAVVGKTTPRQRPVCLEILNDLNQKQKWMKYIIDEKNLITAQISVIATSKTLPSITFQLLCNAAECMEKSKQLLEKSAVLTNIQKRT